MNKIIFALLLLCCTTTICYSQSTSYRLKFKYRISKNKLEKLNNLGYEIKDDKNVTYTFCPNLKKPFKCLVTNVGGDLIIDPWAINDYRVNPYLKKDTIDECYGQNGIINALTPNTLKISTLKRSIVGEPTTTIILPYQTLIVGINTIGLKVRPKITDYNGNKYSSNVISGNINLGFSLGYSFGWTVFTHRSSTSWSVTPSASFGFSSMSLSKEPLKKHVITAYNPSNLVLSPSAGLTFARNDIGIIFTYGYDFMTGSNSDAWAYQGKRFFGLGISAGLKL